MATMAAEATFVDTNVLVYSCRERSPQHLGATARLRRARDDRDPLWFSRQILREYLAVVTRPQPHEPALSNAAANADVAGFLAALNTAEDGPRVTEELLRLLARFPSGGKQVHDANIVATMRAHGITRLITFNAADFRRFDGLIEDVSP